MTEKKHSIPGKVKRKFNRLLKTYNIPKTPEGMAELFDFNLMDPGTAKLGKKLTGLNAKVAGLPVNVFAMVYKYPDQDIGNDTSSRSLARYVATAFGDDVELSLKEMVLVPHSIEKGKKKDDFKSAHNVLVTAHKHRQFYGPMMEFLYDVSEDTAGIWLVRRFPKPLVADLKRFFDYKRESNEYNALLKALGKAFGELDVSKQSFSEVSPRYRGILQRGDLVLHYAENFGWSPKIEKAFKRETRRAHKINTGNSGFYVGRENFTEAWDAIYNRSKEIRIGKETE